MLQNRHFLAALTSGAPPPPPILAFPAPATAIGLNIVQKFKLLPVPVPFFIGYEGTNLIYILS